MHLLGGNTHQVAICVVVAAAAAVAVVVTMMTPYSSTWTQKKLWWRFGIPHFNEISNLPEVRSPEGMWKNLHRI
jgi:hypothetical protein